MDLIVKELRLFILTCLVGSLKDQLKGLAFIWVNSELSQRRHSYTGGGIC